MSVVITSGKLTRELTLAPDPSAGAGYFAGRDPQGRAGDLYFYRLGSDLLPDPASRYQPQGVEGPSQVVGAANYPWRATAWRRPSLCGRVIYELHLGTFTSEGTFTSAIERLDYLADLGVNAIELMPLGDFAGRWNWGYDGVMPFAPARCYGAPEDLRALIDAAHERRLAVIVDVVYNHLGPSGNVLPRFADDYFHRDKGNDWGASLNFTGPNSEPVRNFFRQNALMWLDEYRVDGLRLDATHAIRDTSAKHLVSEIAAAAAQRGAFTIAEDDRNDASIITETNAGGWGVDGSWADDFHHVVRVALTNERHGYYENYAGTLDELITTVREGWLFSGQHFSGWGRARGTPAAHLPAHRFIVCISNHDQVGNRPCGDRLHEIVSPAQYRAASMLLCLTPYTPMIFQGQEWSAGTPFPFFTDFSGDLGRAIAPGRRAEFDRSRMNYPVDELARMPDPQSEATFRSAKLDWSELQQSRCAETLSLYRECLRLRASQPIFQSCERAAWEVRKLGQAGLAIHWYEAKDAWILVVSFQAGVDFVPPNAQRQWRRVIASNEPRFGGTPETEMQGPGAVLWHASAT